MRSNSAFSCENEVCSTLNRPLANDNAAIPSTWSRTRMDATSTSLDSGSNALSVNVPGDTMRVTARSTGPLPVTSPTCSQMTIDSPNFTNLAR